MIYCISNMNHALKSGFTLLQHLSCFEIPSTVSMCLCLSDTRLYLHDKCLRKACQCLPWLWLKTCESSHTQLAANTFFGPTAFTLLLRPGPGAAQPLGRLRGIPSEYILSSPLSIRATFWTTDREYPGARHRCGLCTGSRRSCTDGGGPGGCGGLKRESWWTYTTK
jgi:hypothetical protein